ncbi:MAG: hypothetical protein JJ977_09575 [Kordiimonadaceae bacterium]|nr:hypothetical protein [Kordiimonadaceae bacterium]
MDRISNAPNSKSFLTNKIEQLNVLVPTLIDRGVVFYRNSGFWRTLFLVSGFVGHLLTWTTIIYSAYSSVNEALSIADQHYLFKGIFGIVVSLLFLHIGTSNDELMRTYVDNIIALIFSLTHVLSLSISLYIIYSYNDFSVTFENSSVNWNFGPASIFAVTLYFANYIIASIYRLKSSKKRNVVEFVPIAAVLIYIYFNVDFDLSAFLKVIGSIDETNFASLTLTIIMLFLSLPYFFGVYSRNIAINPPKIPRPVSEQANVEET